MADATQQLTDDPLTGDEATLWRCIFPGHIKPDGVASTAYKTKRLSVYVVADVPGNGVTTAAAVRAKFPPGSRFQFFTAGAARAAGCIVARIPDDHGDDAHREICPSKNPEGYLRDEAYILREAAGWVAGDAPPTP